MKENTVAALSEVPRASVTNFTTPLSFTALAISAATGRQEAIVRFII